MKRNRVLMSASTYSHIRTFHLPYLRAFQRLGWETHVAAAGVPEEAPCIDRAFDLPIQKRFASTQNLKTIAALRSLILAQEYDLILTHTTLAAFLTCAALRGLSRRPRVVKMMHGYLFDDTSPLWKRVIYLAAERFAAPATDLLLVMNQWDLQFATRHRLCARIAKVPGVGVDFRRLDVHTDGQDLRSRWGIPDRARILLYPAEFSKRKNQTLLLHAMRYLPPDVWLVLPGEGALRERVRRLAGRLGLSRRIVFPGYCDRMGDWFREAEIAVTASRSEGLPFNVMEAMYAGCPVAASDVKGHRDLIRHGETGLLFPAGDAKGCAAQVSRLLEDRALWASIRQKAREAVTPYALEQVLPIVMEQYLSVLRDGTTGVSEQNEGNTERTKTGSPCGRAPAFRG